LEHGWLTGEGLLAGIRLHKKYSSVSSRLLRQVKNMIVDCRIDFDLFKAADRSVERCDIRCSNHERKLETIYVSVVAEVPLNVERSQHGIGHVNAAQEQSTLDVKI